jgi:hypothetical protein
LAPDAFQPSLDNALKAAKMADSAGFEALLALARWRGPLPATPIIAVMSSSILSLGAALAMVTRYSPK